MDTPNLPLEGGCQCGAVRYRINTWPLTLYCCHCRECQRQSSSALGMSLRVCRSGLAVEWSAMSARSRDVGQKTAVVGHFCPICGVRLVHARPGGDTVNVKAGTLDDTSWLRPVGHLWVERRQPWVDVPRTLLTYERQPASYDELIAAWARQHPQAPKERDLSHRKVDDIDPARRP